MKKKIYMLSALFFLLDRVSKIIVLNLEQFPIKIINNFFYIDKAFNKGAAFSIFNGYSLIFILIGIIAIIYIHKYMLNTKKSLLEIISYSILIGGIFGNIFDRVVYDGVIDFLSFKFGNYYFPIFNLADIFICTGVFIIMILSLRSDSYGNKSRKIRN